MEILDKSLERRENRRNQWGFYERDRLTSLLIVKGTRGTQPMRDLLSEFLFKLVAYLFPWIVRRFYPVERLIEQVRIRVQNEGDGITFNCAELPSVRVWLRITNLSPIELEFDRIYGHVFHGSQLAEYQSLERRKVPMSSEIEFLIDCSLSQDHVAYLRRNRNNRLDTWLSLNAYVHSRLHDFELKGQKVRSKNVDFINLAAP